MVGRQGNPSCPNEFYGPWDSYGQATLPQTLVFLIILCNFMFFQKIGERPWGHPCISPISLCGIPYSLLTPDQPALAGLLCYKVLEILQVQRGDKSKAATSPRRRQVRGGDKANVATTEPRTANSGIAVKYGINRKKIRKIGLPPGKIGWGPSQFFEKMEIV